jgi:L-asparaginase
MAFADHRERTSDTVEVHRHRPKDEHGALPPRPPMPATSADIGRRRVRIGDRKLDFRVPGTTNSKTPLSFLPTGGTISAKGSDHSYTAGEVSGLELLDGIRMPRNVRVRMHDFSQGFGEGGIDSKNMTDGHWLEMMNKLGSDPEIADKVVITHGSDSMALSAFFLSPTLPRDQLQRKKIVLTGSMKPANSPSADGPKNLSRAFALAKSAKGHGVLTEMAGDVFAAPYFDKRHTSDVRAFKAVNADKVGTVRSGKVELQANVPLLPPRSFDLRGVDRLPDVQLISASPGADPLSTVNLIEAAVKNGAAGIVFAGTGNGTVNDIVAEKLKQVAAEGVLVVRASISGEGEVVRNGHFKDDEWGIACAGKLPTPLHARVLAQVAIAEAMCKGSGNGRHLDMAALRAAFDDYQSPEHRPAVAHGI